MIRYDLACAAGHLFDAWFAGSDAFDQQAEAGLIECPICQSNAVKKQITAPAVLTGRGEREHMATMIEKIRQHIETTHTSVGDRFAEEARAMHDGEKEPAPIYGSATPVEVRGLMDDGIAVTPLPDALVPLKERKKLN
jgi:hypothetical protein